MKRKVRSIIGAVIALALAGTLAGCDAAEFAVDDVKARWEGRSATVYTYDNNSGQTTAKITGNAIYPSRNETFDVIDADGNTDKGAVMSVSVGNNVVDIVGSSTLICEDSVEMIPRADIDIAAQSTDSAVPWLNVLKRRVTDLFQGQSRLVMIKTQNDVPVAAFMGDSVTQVSNNSEIPNSTWFKIDEEDENGKTTQTGYCFVYRVNFMVVDTAILS